MARQLRLRRSSDFRAVQRSGERTSTPNLVVCYRPNGLEHARFGLTVSRRVGNAVVRNRVKRRLREAIRSAVAEEQGPLTGVDVVLIARPRAADASGLVLQREVLDALQTTRRRLGLNFLAGVEVGVDAPISGLEKDA